ncbi:hypothetical protein SFRURICE_003807 [Spodoptera frugiperda]|nr:hypothetical protein SFRURICE_003807 [Spodoptera frugiperda]
MMGLAWFILLMFALDTVTTDAPRARLPPAVSACNTSVSYNKVLLKHVTLLSKYVFTGKVFGVKSGYNGTRIYKVNIRRVLKGDLNDIGVLVKFGTAKSLRFSDATIFVESSSISCPPLRVRTYGIFLTEKRRQGGTLWLSLVIEPLVLTLRSIGIIEAVSIVVVLKQHFEYLSCACAVRDCDTMLSSAPLLCKLLDVFCITTELKCVPVTIPLTLSARLPMLPRLKHANEDMTPTPGCLCSALGFRRSADGRQERGPDVNTSVVLSPSPPS